MHATWCNQWGTISNHSSGCGRWFSVQCLTLRSPVALALTSVLSATFFMKSAATANWVQIITKERTLIKTLPLTYEVEVHFLNLKKKKKKMKMGKKKKGFMLIRSPLEAAHEYFTWSNPLLREHQMKMQDAQANTETGKKDLLHEQQVGL